MSLILKVPRTFDEKSDSWRDFFEEKVFEDDMGDPYIDPELEEAQQGAIEFLVRHWKGNYAQLIERVNEAWNHYRED